MWKALSDAVLVVDLLNYKWINMDTRCQICGLEERSVNHVLFSCSIARQMWSLSRFPSPRNGFDSSTMFTNFSYMLQILKSPLVLSTIKRSFPWLLWNLWKNKNSFCIEGKMYSTIDIVSKVLEEVNLRLRWYWTKRMLSRNQKHDMSSIENENYL